MNTPRTLFRRMIGLLRTLWTNPSVLAVPPVSVTIATSVLSSRIGVARKVLRRLTALMLMVVLRWNYRMMNVNVSATRFAAYAVGSWIELSR